MTKKAGYDSNAIEHLKYPHFVRKKLGMYIGETDYRGVTHLAKEIIGNAIDEASNGHASEIHILISKDGTVTVKDNGRGIPIGPHKSDPKRDTLDILFCEVHSGGKMDAKSGSYETSIGTHGVGLAVVNALSDRTEVWTFRNRHWQYMGFKRGIIGNKKPKPSPLPKLAGIPNDKKGTMVRFTPDLSVFDKGAKLDAKSIVAWVEEMSWVVPAKFHFTIEGQKPFLVYRKDGLKGRFKHECARLKVEPAAEPFVYQDRHVSVMVGWTDSSETHLMSSVSGAKTSQGGTHVKGFLAGLDASFAELAKKGDDYTLDALQTGMIAVVNVNVAAPRFSSQDKAKLVSPEAQALTQKVMEDSKKGLLFFLKRNRDFARSILDRAVEVTRLHEEFRADKRLAAALKSPRGKSALPKALTVSTTKDNKLREIFIVEGKSAEGSAVAARDPSYQEVLSLSGKIPNAWKMDFSKVMDNFRIIDILKSIGYDPNNPTNTRMGKLIILTDADEDGLHISALILGFLQKVAPFLYDKGLVYLVDAPLFIYRTDKGHIFAPTLADLQNKVPGRFDPARVTRLKGWGEAPADVLRRVAFDKKTRKLKRMLPLNGKAELQTVVDALGEGAEARKILLGL